MLLLCAAYVLPGVFGRAPWRNADISTTALMVAMAEGRTPWWAPQLGGVSVDAAPLPHALGAAAVWLLSPWVEPSFAARLPSVLLLILTLACTWYAAFLLARTEAAQPVTFAFGGEATHVDYARAIADCALLALLSTLGLLLLGHEVTPELAQLAATSLLLWGMAAAPYRTGTARAALLLSLPMLAASGAPMIAACLGVAVAVIAARSQYEQARAAIPWIAVSTLAAVAVGSWLGQWHWTHAAAIKLGALPKTLQMMAWFLWPSWLLAVWTLWRWRRQSLHRHITVPLSLVVVAVLASLLMNGSQRALLLSLPAMAVLAAFALPTVKRSTGSAIDWFSMCLFTASALFVWVAYLSLQTGMPSWPAQRVERLYGNFQLPFEPLALILALVGSLAWLGLVRWRTGRHRSAMWKSLVLPASGVALTWLLLMTLLLPLVDHTRGMKTWAQSLAPYVVRDACIAAPGIPMPYVAALELHGAWRVDAATLDLSKSTCKTALQKRSVSSTSDAPSGWREVGRVRRPSDRQEVTVVLQRAPAVRRP